MTTAIVCAVIVATYDRSARNGGSMKAASAGSPTQPRPRLAIGDAKLGRGNVADRIVQCPSHGPGATVAFGDQLVDTGLSDRDQCELSRHEEPVGEDQDENGQYTDGEDERCRASARSLGRL